MDLDAFLYRLTESAESIATLVRGLSDEQARWRPDEESWSVLEVVNHLYDEEREDFRARIERTLADPEAAWEPIDPQGWVVARAYNERMIEPSLDAFLTERRQSIVWLQQLEEPDWSRAHVHPAGFTVRAGDLLASWAAHDLLHLRQLVELHYRWLAEQVAPHDIRYAGAWEPDERG